MTEQLLLAKINELESKLMDSYDLKSVIYIGYTDHEKNICKFGYTNDIKTRLIAHRFQISEHFKPEYIIETIYNREVEKDIKLNLSHRIISKRYNNKIQTELILLGSELNIKDIYNLVIQYKEVYNDKNVITKLTKEIEELTLEKMEKREEIKEISNTISQKRNTIRKIKGHIYKCSECDYSSEFKGNVVKHINKDKKCSEYCLKILTIEIYIQCELCNKYFSDANSRNRHLKSCNLKS